MGIRLSIQRHAAQALPGILSVSIPACLISASLVFLSLHISSLQSVPSQSYVSACAEVQCVLEKQPTSTYSPRWSRIHVSIIVKEPVKCNGVSTKTEQLGSSYSADARSCTSQALVAGLEPFGFGCRLLPHLVPRYCHLPRILWLLALVTCEAGFFR